MAVNPQNPRNLPDVHPRFRLRGWNSSANGGGEKAEWRRESHRRRKPTTWEELDGNWEAIIDEQARVGAGIPEIRVALNISKATYEKFYREVPDFKEVMDDAMDMSLAWWEHVARCNLANFKFRDGLFKFMMKIRFGIGEDSPRSVGKAASAAKEVGNTQVSEDILSDLYSGGDGNPLPVSPT